MSAELNEILRLVIAAAVGVAVGFNRELRGKPLGMRTLALVSLGSAIAALAAIDFQDLRAYPDAASRVIQGVLQGVLTGIGFMAPVWSCVTPAPPPCRASRRPRRCGSPPRSVSPVRWPTGRWSPPA